MFRKNTTTDPTTTTNTKTNGCQTFDEVAIVDWQVGVPFTTIFNTITGKNKSNKYHKSAHFLFNLWKNVSFRELKKSIN